MKYSDYKRLGKISIASRKKSTKNTVRGISFGLIIIIPIIYFTLAFYLDLTTKINEVRTIASFSVTTKHFSDTTGDYIVKDSNYSGYNSSMLGYERFAYISELEGVEDYVVGQYVNFSNLYEENYMGLDAPQTSLIYGDKKVKLAHSRYIDYSEERQLSLSTNFKFIHPDISSSPYITKAEADDLKNHYNIDNVFIAGSGFTGDGRGQIILSEKLLKKFSIPITDVLNKNISLEFVPLNYDSLMSLDDDYDPTNTYDSNEAYDSFHRFIYGKPITIFNEFEVVGIISENLYKLESRDEEADFWLHANSLSSDTTKYPQFTYTVIEESADWTRDFWVVTYEKDPLIIGKEVTDNKEFFLPLGFGANFTSGDWMTYPYPVLKSIIQCENYHQATIVEGVIDALYKAVFKDTYYSFTNSSYYFFSMIYKVGLYASIVLLSFGGIIFFATLLNLYNSINYSVQSRRNYIGVMRAIGSRERIIPRLYFVEIMLIFMRSFLWILIFSGLISFGIKALVDSGFRYIAEDLGIALKLNFLYYPVTIIIMVLVEFSIAFLYSQVACRHVSKKPILEILKDEK